jgi:5-methylcytosine-specific restriction endonuclease McrA
MSKPLQQSRQLAFERQRGQCFYCGLPMWLSGPQGPSALRCTAEHLIPRSEGGGNGPSNIVAACWHCNHTRHKRKRPPEPELYQAQVRRRVAQGRWFSQAILYWAQKDGAVSEVHRMAGGVRSCNSPPPK